MLNSLKTRGVDLPLQTLEDELQSFQPIENKSCGNAIFITRTLYCFVPLKRKGLHVF